MRASTREAESLAELVKIIWPEHTPEELTGIITDYMTSADSAVFAERADGQRVAALSPVRRLSGRKQDHLFQKDALTGGSHMEYRVDDKALEAPEFIGFVNQVWPGTYDLDRTQDALSRTLNLTAYDGDRLVGCLRILTDGYFFGTITEMLVLPEYQKKGIGSRLLALAKEHTPTMLYFGSQPGVEAFYEKNGCPRGLPSYVIEKKR